MGTSKSAEIREELLKMMDEFKKEAEKDKNKTARRRARKLLSNIAKLGKDYRKATIEEDKK